MTDWTFSEVLGLYIHNVLGAVVSVLTHDLPTIIISLTGDVTMTRDITVRQEGDIVCVASTRQVTELDLLKPPPTLMAVVPIGTVVSVGGCWSSVSVGDTLAQVFLTTEGAGDADIGDVESVNILTIGGGSVHVASVTQKVEIEHRGIGTIYVNGGRIQQLTVLNEGAGIVNIRAKAQRATLKVNGAGGINTAGIANTPDTVRRGAGQINLGFWS